MSNDKSAFVNELKWIIECDMEEKKKVLQDFIDNPDKYPELKKMSGKDFIMVFLFGDLQNFIDKWGNL